MQSSSSSWKYHSNFLYVIFWLWISHIPLSWNEATYDFLFNFWIYMSSSWYSTLLSCLLILDLVQILRTILAITVDEWFLLLYAGSIVLRSLFHTIVWSSTSMNLSTVLLFCIYFCTCLYFRLPLCLWIDFLQQDQKIPVAPPEKTKEDVLLFFKLYTPEKEQLRLVTFENWDTIGSESLLMIKFHCVDCPGHNLANWLRWCRYVGRTFVKAGGKPTDILERLCDMAGFAPNEEIQLYEV